MMAKEPTARRRPKWRWWSLTLNILLIALLGWQLSAANLTGTVDPAATPRPQVPREAVEGSDFLTAQELSTIRLFEAVSPSVVFITTHRVARDPFSLNITRLPRGTGSGFVWNDEGYIVTNYHVVEGAQAAEVMLADQTSLEADLVGVAPEKDLAVLKVDAPADKLHPILLGQSSGLRVGQTVLAIGNPFGLDQTLTTGVISGLGREITGPEGGVISDLIQTDAAINPGNSGGPLLNTAGQMIGMNTAIYSLTGGYSGIGLAIPVDVVNRVVPEIIEHGHAIRPGLGVQLVHDSISRRLGIPGLLIQKVTEGSAAERAGLQGTIITRRGTIEQLGDIIIGVEGERVRTLTDLYRKMNGYEVGDRVTVTVLRPEEEEALEFEVELQPINIAE